MGVKSPVTRLFPGYLIHCLLRVNGRFISKVKGKVTTKKSDHLLAGPTLVSPEVLVCWEKNETRIEPLLSFIGEKTIIFIHEFLSHE